ncbi:hypothetical protein DPMN_116071 [Dreissena polymorpha]|uniref:Uncharacterized protein n=1 Tax=Dreissena polymorpha TaxID=45954 RepID=A0A9D4KN65_DREPO|nr:hypothetical protein DPMN_116071 [Dreissena polymorpha]
MPVLKRAKTSDLAHAKEKAEERQEVKKKSRKDMLGAGLYGRGEVLKCSCFY